MALAADFRDRSLWLRGKQGKNQSPFPTRVLGTEGEALLLSQPYRDGRLIVFQAGATVKVSLTDPAHGAAPVEFATKVLERRLRPVPSLLVELPEDLGRALQGQPPRRARVIAVTSGKGGVGKTTVTANLGLALAELGQAVTILDADLGMANVDLLLGLNSGGTLTHLINGEKTLDEIVIEGPGGLRVIPGASGLADLANLNEWQFGRLLDSLMQVEESSDIVLVDTGAGLSRNVTNFFLAADEVLLVTNPEPPATLDAYGVLKTLAEQNNRQRVSLIINRAATTAEALAVADRLADTAERFLGFRPEYLGAVLEDRHAVEAVKRQALLVQQYPNSSAAQSVRRLAAQLTGGPVIVEQDAAAALQPQAGGFFQRLRQLFANA